MNNEYFNEGMECIKCKKRFQPQAIAIPKFDSTTIFERIFEMPCSYCSYKNKIRIRIYGKDWKGDKL